jgi:hypothetical protein
LAVLQKKQQPVLGIEKGHTLLDMTLNVWLSTVKTVFTNGYASDAVHNNGILEKATYLIMKPWKM